MAVIGINWCSSPLNLDWLDITQCSRTMFTFDLNSTALTKIKLQSPFIEIRREKIGYNEEKAQNTCACVYACAQCK